MTAQLRRQLALVVIGVAAALVALLVATWLRQDACLEAGGRWLAATRTCELANGAVGPGLSAGRAYAVGAIVGVLAATVLWRTFTFFASRSTHRRS